MCNFVIHTYVQSLVDQEIAKAYNLVVASTALYCAVNRELKRAPQYCAIGLDLSQIVIPSYGH